MARLRGTRLPLIVSAASIINLAAAEFQLDPFGDNSIRIRVAPPGQNIVNPELQALLLEAPTLTTSVSWEGSNSLTNGNLQVTVDPSTGYLTATRLSDGRVLLKQTELTWGPVSVPGTRAGSVTAAVSFAGTPGEKIYGLGEHRTGTVQQSPYNKTFAESQLYATSRGSDVSIPWYASSQGYGFVWNSPSFGSVDVSEAAITWESVATLNVDVWVTTTSADPALDPSRSPYADLLRHYVDAVGHAPPMPYYATGFIQCKDRYRNQTQLLEVAHGYVDRGLPISVIVIDWQHWVNQGDWSFSECALTLPLLPPSQPCPSALPCSFEGSGWLTHLPGFTRRSIPPPPPLHCADPRCWPDPQGMVDELQTLGIEPMVTFWPFQTLAATHWAQYNSSGFLAPNVSGALLPYDSLGSAEEYLVDTTNADARNATFEACVGQRVNTRRVRWGRSNPLVRTPLASCRFPTSCPLSSFDPLSPTLAGSGRATAALASRPSGWTPRSRRRSRVACWAPPAWRRAPTPRWARRGRSSTCAPSLTASRPAA